MRRKQRTAVSLSALSRALGSVAALPMVSRLREVPRSVLSQPGAECLQVVAQGEHLVIPPERADHTGAYTPIRYPKIRVFHCFRTMVEEEREGEKRTEREVDRDSIRESSLTAAAAAALPLPGSAAAVRCCAMLTG
jgi:hypothetical protein